MEKIYLYSRFERFWHWVQGLLIILLMITGFEIHGYYTLLGFETAEKVHSTIGLSWLILFVFIVFWLFTTGEWKQYIPTTKKLFDMVWYYSVDIFRGKPHPVQKSRAAKHNPLQRLTYLGLSALLLPLAMITGLLYYTYNIWETTALGTSAGLGIIAYIHLALAYILVSFLIIHVYMTTTGHSVFAHMAAMVTGWEEVEKGTAIEDWEKRG